MTRLRFGLIAFGVLALRLAAGGCSSGTTGSHGSGGTSGTAGSTGGGSGSGTGGTTGSGGSITGSGGSITGAAGSVSGAGGTAGGGVPVSRGCSEMPIRTAPPAGKESFLVTTPADARFPFSKHWVGIFSGDPRFVSMTSLTDIDNDGDLDFACGQREDVGGGMNWFEHCGPDHWVRHHVGEGHTSAAGGGAFDVNGDGWVDLIASDSWYANPKNPRSAASWQRHLIKSGLRVEEVIIGDINKDGKGDALYLMTNVPLQWLAPGADPTVPWTDGAIITSIGSQIQRQGGAIGDIDGDGKNDVVGGRQFWHRNVNGDGKTWEHVPIPAGATFTNEPLTYLGDLDGDDDLDIQMVTHWGGEAGARVSWFENVDGKGITWTEHMLASGKGWLHDVVAADFDNDGDLDIYVGKNVGPQWIYENVDGKGNFVEHTIAADWRGHEARVGDVDCDGDLDIVGKPWGDPNEGGETARPAPDVVYLQNMLVDQGGKPVFDRPNQITFQKEPPLTCKR